MTISYDKRYYDAAYSEFDDPVFRRRWALASALTGGYADETFHAALDFGAGLGQNLACIRATEKWAVDINPVSQAACQDQGFIWSDTLDAVPDRHFDAILARHSLEHVPDPHACLEKLCAKAAPNARLYLAVPVERDDVPADLEHFDLQRHLYSWIPHTLRNLCLSAGWQPLWIRKRCGRGLHRSLVLTERAPQLFLTLRDLADRYLERATGEIVACCVPARDRPDAGA